MKKDERPPQGLTYEGGRPREEDSLTRRRLSSWDRSKWLILLVVIWFLLVWSLMADNPLVGFLDACRIEVRTGWWVFVLGGLEVIHQVHFLISERSAGYHQFWVNNVWGRSERLSERNLSAWTRYRIGRVIRWVIVIAAIAIIAGKVMHNAPLAALVLIPGILWHDLPTFLQYAVYLLFAVAQFALLFWFLSRGGMDVYYPDDIKTRFTDVWGQDQVLERVKENIIFLEHPEIVEDRGGYVPGGILLWGPPGTGKTLMAEAVAGETGRPYVFVDPGAFTNMFMGVGILKVKSLFRKLRKLSLRYGGVIVFFDEADSLGNRGIAMGGAPGPAGAVPAPFADSCRGFSYLSQDVQSLLTRDALGASPGDGIKRDRQMIGGMMNGGGGGGMGTLQALLTELSGLKKPRGFFNRVVRRALGMRPKPPPHYRILVMMATNLPSTLDPALLRPGRIDRMYRVGYPSKPGRIRTYEGYLDKVSHELTADQIDKLATITPYATGASIKDLVNEALIIAIGDGRDVITYQDVINAKRLKALGPPEDVEYIERERHATAVHEACHAVAAYLTRKHLIIDIATIEKGSYYLGMVSSIKPEDLFTTWRSEYESDILVSLASLAGERMFFGGDSSSGVSGDLDSATQTATWMEGYWGMGKTVSSAATARRLEAGTPGAGNRNGAAETIGEVHGPTPFGRLADRIEDNLSSLLLRAEELLRDNEHHVLALAHALESHKTISGEDVTAVMEGQRGPLVDGTVYNDEDFITRLREYHVAALQAHEEHGNPDVPLPVPAAPAYAIADGFGSSSLIDGSNGANGNNGSTDGSGTDDVLDFGGLGSANGSQGNGSNGGSNGGPLGAPTYDPPVPDGTPDDGDDEH